MDYKELIDENADEIVRALRENAEWCDANEYEVPICMGDNQREAADLIESLQAQIAAERVKFAELQRYNVDCTKQFGMVQMDKVNLQNLLTESQRRERAAVEDLELNAACPCRVCKNSKCYRRNGRENCKFEWRGPQEAGKGEAK